jgi:DNA-binding transcriptional MerR regulator
MHDERQQGMGIAELARRAGVTPRTIRYYVAEGLLPAPAGRGQRRAYGPEHLDRLEAIRELKAAYLPLHEIRRRLGDDLTPQPLRGANIGCADVPLRRGEGEPAPAGGARFQPDGAASRNPAATESDFVGAGFQATMRSTAPPNLPASASTPSTAPPDMLESSVTTPSTAPPDMPASSAPTLSTSPPNLPAPSVAAPSATRPIGFGPPQGVGRIEIFDPPETAWRRHVLAQGVELHVQETDDPKLAQAIQRLLREAAAILDGKRTR